MKVLQTIALVLMLSLTTVGTAFANVNYSSSNVYWAVTNNTPNYVTCSGTLYGMTNVGFTASEQVSVVIPPFNSAYRTLYTTGNWVFVNGWASINCY